MQKIIMGAIAALSLAMSSYIILLALEGSGKPKASTHQTAAAAATRSPADIAARDRMARLVAEVAARTAAQTAKSVVMSRMQVSQPAQHAQVAEEKTASR